MPDAKKTTHGGARPGAGRPPGRKNSTTLAREAAIREATLAVVGEMGDNALAALDPLDILMMAARIALRAGDLPLAVSASDKAAPYKHRRLGGDLPGMVPLPEDLMPDPPSIGDEPGPPGGVIGEWGGPSRGYSGPGGQPRPNGDEPTPENPIL